VLGLGRRGMVIKINEIVAHAIVGRWGWGRTLFLLLVGRNLEFLRLLLTGQNRNDGKDLVRHRFRGITGSVNSEIVSGKGRLR
jgi:hypothetical protein